MAEHRTGRVENNQFFESLGGSLIQSRATYPEALEQVAVDDQVRTFRISTNTLGNGFVESISNSTLLAIRDRQPEGMRGTALMVPVLEGNGNARIGASGGRVNTPASNRSTKAPSRGPITSAVLSGERLFNQIGCAICHVTSITTAEFASMANQIRTAPLWALRTRNRLMHDGLTFTKQEAIRRHGGQAASVTRRYNALSNAQKNQLLAFLDSL